MSVRQKEEQPKLNLIKTHELGVHDHPCLIYETLDELTNSFVPYLRSGLVLGEQCIYFIDENSREFVIEAMQTGGFDLKPYLNAGAFLIISTKDAHLKDGHFEEQKMLSYWSEAIDASRRAGFAGLRAAVEMTWALSGRPGCEVLCPYEARLNKFISSKNVGVVCQYHRQKFPPAQLKDVIHAHPVVITENEILQNVNFVANGDLIKGDSILDVQVMLDNLALTNKLVEGNRSLQQANQALQESLQAEKKARAELARLEGERHRRELAESKARLYRRIAEAIPQIVWTANNKCEVDFLNSRWYQLTEMYPENSLGSGWLREIHPDDRPNWSTIWNEAIVSEKPFEIQARLRMADDKYRLILFRAVRIWDDDVDDLKWFGTGTDIHDQKSS